MCIYILHIFTHKASKNKMEPLVFYGPCNSLETKPNISVVCPLVLPSFGATAKRNFRPT